MSSLWDTGISYLKELSLTTKIIIGGTSLLLLIQWLRQKQSRLPPGPRGLPLIGNLLSQRSKAMETSIKEWEQKYGPVFTIHLGPMPTVVITDIDLATDALVKLGSAFSGRPYMYSIDKITEGSRDISNAPYGEVWKIQRKVASQAMSCDFEDPTFRKIVAVVDDIQNRGSNGFLEDFFPPSRLWPSNNFSELIKGAEWLVSFIHKRMKEHRDNFDEAAITCLADNIIQAEKLAEIDGQPSDQKLTEAHYSLIVFDVFGAGVETTRVTLDWIFLVLVNNLDIQARMQKEIDAVIGEKVPGREHRFKLAYCEAVIFEVMRLYPVAPYGMLHETLCDAEIGGYKIPKKTAVLISLLKILRDPNHWEDPLTFKPERFLDETESKVTVRTKSFIPFSMGHRACPGEGLAKMELLYIVVGLLQKFSFSLPPGEKVEPVLLVQGFANNPPPYKAVIKHRFNVWNISISKWTILTD